MVHVIESLGSGGAERLLYTNLKHLDRARFRHTVVVLFAEGTHWREPILALGIDVIELGVRGRRDLPAACIRLRRWLVSHRADVVHTHLWMADIVARVAGRIARVPVISTIHSLTNEPGTWVDGSGVPIWKRRIQRYLDRITSTWACERLIAVSEYVRQSAHTHLQFPLSRIDVIANPVDIDEIASVGSRERARVREDLGLPEGTMFLLAVARISPEKGLIYAIRALPDIARRHPAVRLVVVGSLVNTELYEELRREAADLDVLNHVQFTGPRRDIPALLGACDLFVFPSLHEGFGIALVEAMVAGCACVATNMGPITEIVDPERTGWLVAPGDAGQLADAISRALDDPVGTAGISEAAAAFARAAFEPRAAASRLAEIYESVVRPRHPAIPALHH